MAKTVGTLRLDHCDALVCVADDALLNSIVAALSARPDGVVAVRPVALLSARAYDLTDTPPSCRPR